MTKELETARKGARQALAEIVGGNLGEDNIRREGTALILPANKDIPEVMEMLADFHERQEKHVPIIRQFRYRYYDGLIAFKRVIKQLTGMSATTKTLMTFFGPVTPPSVQVEVAFGEYEDGPQGVFPVELFEGELSTGTWRDDELGTLFQMSADVPRKYEAAVQGLFKLIEEELETNSIYRGKPITAQDPANFLDLRGVDPTKVIYTDDVMAQLDANVWSLLDHTEAMRENGLPLKRTVLLHGPYGTGKTLAAYLTAQRAVANGWTFIFVRPGKDDLNDAMATAKLYQPSVLFFEDIDTTADPEWDVSHLLDIFDGLQSKGIELVGIFTTNHPEKIHKGLVRPGRLDAVIEISNLDADGIWKMIHNVVRPELLGDNLDKDAIAEAMEGFLPAFIKEAIDRATRYSIARNNGKPDVLTTEDFVNAARGLRPQLELMEGAKDAPEKNPLDEALGRLLTKVVGDMFVVSPDMGAVSSLAKESDLPDWAANYVRVNEKALKS